VGIVASQKAIKPALILENFSMLSLKGIPLSPEGNKDGRGREPTYRVSVHKNGQIVIGSTYTEDMGLNPGDEFEIKLGYKHIHLIQMSEGESEGT
jgi:AbrB-like transcriptional regulator